MRIADTLAISRRTFSAMAARVPGRVRLPRGLALALAACLLLAGVVAQAQTTFDYNVAPRTFRACRLLLPYLGAGGTWVTQASDDRSLMFEGMRRYPNKPAGWDLINPLAPASATAGDPTHPVLPSTRVADLPVGARGYWEVALDPHPELIPTGATALSTPYTNYNGPQLDKFDLIYVWAGGQDAGGTDILLNLQRPEWRAALLRAVYEGAVLWIDQKRDHNGTAVTNFAPPGPMLAPGTVLDPGPVFDPTPPFSMAPGTQVTGAVRHVAANGGAFTLARDRLLSYPFLLTDTRDIPYLGRYPNQVATSYPLSMAQSATNDSLALRDATWQRVVNVWDGALDNNNIAVARYGAGAVVVSAGDIGYDVVDWWLGQAQNRPLQTQAADCKFAWNVAALAGSFEQAQGNAPAQSASVTATPPPLGINWQYPDRFTSAVNGIGPVVTAPVVNKGMVYAISLPKTSVPTRNAQLLCFDADPSSDLDGDGNADDGVADYSLGHSYDMVWSVDLGANWTPRTAGPCVATMLPPGGTQTDVVLVSVVRPNPVGNDYGEIRAYNAHTGVQIWARRMQPYDVVGGGNGMVVDLSTPVVYRNFAFCTASEWDPNIDTTGGIEDAYGRVHAFDMNYIWGVAANQNLGAQWVYPSPSNNPAGDADNAPGVPSDHATPEIGRSLPSFQDPRWVWQQSLGAGAPEIPPFPTPKPVVVLPTGPLANTGVDVFLQCSTPISLIYGGTNQTNTDPANGGSDYLFIPAPATPVGGVNPGVDQLNKHAFRVWLPQGVTAANTRFFNNSTIVSRVDDPNINAAGQGTWQDPADGRVYAYFRAGAAREYLLPSQAGAAAPNGVRDTTSLQLGAPIAIHYEINTGAWTDAGTVAATLPGPVARVTKALPNQRRVASAASANGCGLYATDVVEDNNGVVRNFDYATAYSGGPGAIICRSVDSGATQWEFRPHRALTDSSTRLQLARGGSAVERSNDTVYAAVTSTLNPVAGNTRIRVPQVLGLNSDPRLTVRLAGAVDSELVPGAAVTITTVGASGLALATIPAATTDTTGEIHAVYRVDDASRTIEFSTDQAGWVDNVVGSLWGKPIWVSYKTTNPAATVTDELHVLPDILRFQYSPGIVRLQHGMVGLTATLPSFTLVNGVPLSRVGATATALDETSFPASPTPLPAGWTGVLPRGVLDVRSLQLPSGEPVLPGTEIMVTYTYYDDLTRGAVTTHERVQIPVNFGASSAAPVLADRTLHVGTEGYRPDGQRGAANPLQPSDPGAALGFNSVRQSFLSVLLDPITRVVRGSLAAPAIPEATTYGAQGTAVVGGAAAVDSGGLLVGSNMMTRLNQSDAAATGYQGQGYGFVSRLKPERTLISDNTRLVETIAQKPSWVCVGSHVAMFHEGLNADIESQDRKVTPFSRPAKALYLSNGDILVADTGNDRVIEIDRTGRQVWPLDAPLAANAPVPAYSGGYDYYTSNQNSILDLQRPSDCFRYYVEYHTGTTYTSVSGNLLPLYKPTPSDWTTWHGTECHTVIADAGHDRVIDVVTTVDTLGVQSHRVDVLTPSAVRLGTPSTMVQIAYTKAQPIFDPNSGVVTGYLCVASNLHQLVVVERNSRLVDPPSNRTPAGGSVNWSWLAWLYDSDTTDTNYAPSNPLIFRNIRDVEVSYEGTQIFLTVTCGQFAGRYLNLTPNVAPHYLSTQGAGIFEYCIMQNGGGWARVPAAASASPNAPVTADDPIWWFTRANFIYSNPWAAAPTRRTISNVQYADVDASTHWMEMAWNPVSAIRLPADRRPVGAQRQARHLVTNAAELIQNLDRNNVRSTASNWYAPASLFSTVYVINSDDNNDAAPDNDTHDLDRREAIPDPQDADWSDPFNQPTFADRK